jgi:hypothetical protein
VKARGEFADVEYDGARFPWIAETGFAPFQVDAQWRAADLGVDAQAHQLHGEALVAADLGVAGIGGEGDRLGGGVCHRCPTRQADQGGGAGEVRGQVG